MLPLPDTGPAACKGIRSDATDEASGTLAQAVAKFEGALRAEWSTLQKQTDEVLQKYLQRQEEAVSHYLSIISLDAAVGGTAVPASRLGMAIVESEVPLKVPSLSPALRQPMSSSSPAVASEGQASDISVMSYNILEPSSNTRYCALDNEAMQEKFGDQRRAAFRENASLSWSATSYPESIDEDDVLNVESDLPRSASSRRLEPRAQPKGAVKPDGETYDLDGGAEWGSRPSVASGSVTEARMSGPATLAGIQLDLPVMQVTTSLADIFDASEHEGHGWTKHKVLSRFSGVVKSWDRITEPPRHGWLAQVVLNKPFNLFCGFIIMVNVLFTWYVTNYEIAHSGEGTILLDIIDRVFVAFYVVELALKLAVHRWHYFCNADISWNIFDFVLVGFSLCDLILTDIVRAGGGTNLTFMRMLRIFRVAKILRGLRVVRFIEELRLMLNSLVGSLTSLMWSIVMLALFVYVFSLIFVQGASGALLSGEVSSEETQRILEAFGTVELAMLSSFESIAGGNDWHNYYQLMLLCGWMYAVVFVFFIVFSEIAILNILTAVFVNKAMALAKPDADNLAREKRKKDIEAYKELCQLSRAMDRDRSGTITIEELSKHVLRGRLGARLSVLGINVTDTQSFFDLLLFTAGLDPEVHREIPIKDFVDGCMRLRGCATGIGLQGVFREVRAVHRLMLAGRREHLGLALGHVPSSPRSLRTVEDVRNLQKVSGGNAGEALGHTDTTMRF